jgi:hypothetical protein
VPSVCPLAFCMDAAANHILCNCLPPHIDVVFNGVHPTLLQHLIRGWVDPLLLRPPPRYMLLCHPIRCTKVESLEPGQSGCAQDPCLAALQEDGLHDCLVELGANSWWCILLAQHLSDPCPRPMCLAKLASHGLDVIVILREQAAEIPEYLDPL